jgi:hypothetical protein
LLAANWDDVHVIGEPAARGVREPAALRGYSVDPGGAQAEFSEEERQATGWSCAAQRRHSNDAMMI